MAVQNPGARKRVAKATAAKSAAPAKVVVQPTREALPVESSPAEGPTKQKLVRDSFTMPKSEYELLGALKQRLSKLEHPVKKSELLRAGVVALDAMSDADLRTMIGRIPSLKTGRPKSAKPHPAQGTKT